MNKFLGDYLARACFPKPQVNLANKVRFEHDGRPTVYKKRWAILAAYSLSYFMWNFSGLRHTALISEYALYFDTTNEFSAPPEWGIDFFTISESATLIAFYPFAGKIVDSYGLGVLKWASAGMIIGNWWWFFSFDNYPSVIVARTLVSFCGSIIASSLLRLSHNWFAADQRALAVAIGALIGTIGGGFALLIPPAFSTGDLEINFDLKSCKQSFQNTFDATEDSLECSDEALDAFCCAAETDIDSLNAAMAAIVTVVAIFTIIVIEDAPPTPPSKAGIVKEGPGMVRSLGLMFKHRNYTFLCLADFFCSGPALLIFSTIDRILPGNVSEYATISAAIALAIAIPASGYFAYILSKTQKFYEMTAAGYVLGFVCFFSVAVLLLIENDILNFFVLVFASVAVVCYILWTVSVYELKMEYIFDATWALQGYIVAVDRTIINLSGVIFLAAIPPERFDGENIDGRQFTFLVGSVAMLIGVIFVLSIKDKYKYLRTAYEARRGSVGELEDVIEIFPELDEIKDLEREKPSEKGKVDETENPNEKTSEETESDKLEEAKPEKLEETESNKIEQSPPIEDKERPKSGKPIDPEKDL